MADVITRFKLETTQYDSKLRDEAKRLADFSRQASIAGSEFGKFAQKNVEAARAFGSIATSATNAKDKVKELVGAFNTVAKEYNMLTKEQQQSDYGKALAESMQQLKGRIAEAKHEMNSTGGILGQLKDKFVVNIDALKLFNAGVTAAKAALDVAKDAFFASEATVDEWGRVMAASKSLYEGFLTALNTGDISGYLSRIDSIVQAARAAYNELDRLGTMKTIQAPQISAQQTENERMRMMIQTGRYIAPIDGRKASMQNGQLLTPDQIKRIEQQLQGGMQKLVTLVGNEVSQTGRAIDAVYNRQAQELGLSLKEFRKGTSSMAEFDKRMAGYDQYQKWRQEHTTIDLQSGRETVARGNPFEQFAKWGTFRVDGDRYNDLVKLIQQRDQQAGQAYSMQSQAYRTINRAEGITIKGIMGGGGGSTGGGGLTPEELEAQLEASISSAWEKAMTKATLSADTFKAPEIEGASEAWQAYVDSVKSGSAEAVDSVQSLIEAFNTLNKAEGVVPTGEINKEAKDSAKSFQTAASAISSVGSALSQIEDPGAKVMGIVAQAIATVAQAYAGALSSDSTTKSNIWAFIAAAAASTASMITTISSIHQATGYANGGIVGGNSYSGDNVGPVMLDAGELILNRAQQANVAQGLQGNNIHDLNLSATIKGEDIRLAINNNGRRTGRGEYVTTRFR